MDTIGWVAILLFVIFFITQRISFGLFNKAHRISEIPIHAEGDWAAFYSLSRVIKVRNKTLDKKVRSLITWALFFDVVSYFSLFMIFFIFILNSIYWN